MADLSFTGKTWRVAWRLGGSRAGTPQSTRWTSENKAKAAKALVEDANHNIDKYHIYHLLIPGTPLLIPGTPLPDAERSETTFAEFAKIWLEANRENIGAGQRDRNASDLRRMIIPEIGHLRLDQVRPPDIAAIVNKLRACDCLDGKRGPICAAARKGHGLDYDTVLRYLMVAGAVFNYALECRVPGVVDNPVRTVKKKFQPTDLEDCDDPESERVHLTDAEWALLRSKFHPDSRQLVDYLIGTGARWSEATAASVGSIDPMAKPEPVAKIRRAWKNNPPSQRTPEHPGPAYLGLTKGRTARLVEIHQGLVDDLLPLILGEPDEALLFRAPEGGRIMYNNFRRRRWDPAVVAACRCDLHPPLPEGIPTPTGALGGPRCGDNGGLTGRGTPCGAFVQRGYNRCPNHCGVPRYAVSICDCPDRLKKFPTPHDLRHTHAGWLLDDGVPIAYVSQRLGHRSQEVTELIYGGRMPKQRVAVTKHLSARLGPRNNTARR